MGGNSFAIRINRKELAECAVFVYGYFRRTAIAKVNIYTAPAAAGGCNAV